jgi:hypothetical protein
MLESWRLQLIARNNSNVVVLVFTSEGTRTNGQGRDQGTWHVRLKG